MKQKLLFFMAFLLPCLLFAQSRYSVKGNVIGAVSNDPVPGVIVTVTEHDIQVTTDADGRFTLRNMQPGKYVLHLNSVMITPKSVTIEVNDLGDTVVDCWYESPRMQVKNKEGRMEETDVLDVVATKKQDRIVLAAVNKDPEKARALQPAGGVLNTLLQGMGVANPPDWFQNLAPRTWNATENCPVRSLVKHLSIYRHPGYPISPNPGSVHRPLEHLRSRQPLDFPSWKHPRSTGIF